jgi:excisionase family DNA binding protein
MPLFAIALAGQGIGSREADWQELVSVACFVLLSAPHYSGMFLFVNRTTQQCSLGGLGLEREDEMLVSVKEAAKRLGGISPWTVYSWFGKGKLRRTKIGSRTMIRVSELRRLINEGDDPITVPSKEEL